MIDSLTIIAPAKINLGLVVYGKREDGYHEIKTIFQAVRLADELEISLIKEGVELVCEGEPIPNDQGNIVFKAAMVFLSHLKKACGVHILVRKRIPVAAGLGGGSSDAASTLKGLNVLFELPFSQAGLLEMGKKLGADVPFFLYSNSALGEGIGTELTPSPPLSGVWIIMVNPGFEIPTKWVYNNINTDLLLTKKADHINMLRLFLEKNDLSKLGTYLHNDLELVVAERYPIIRELKNRLLSAGALGAIMSGSGATVVGFFADRIEADEAFENLRNEGKGWKVFLTEPLT